MINVYEIRKKCEMSRQKQNKTQKKLKKKNILYIKY